MNVTVTLDDALAEKLQQIAAERETTIDELVLRYLTELAIENSASDVRAQQLEALHRNVEALQRNIGKHTWSRADLNARP